MTNKFWDRVEKTEGCWLWLGPRNSFGYGLAWSEGQKRELRAHRVAWELANGTVIPEGKIIRHACDNPRCVRPEHLLLGTRAENSADMVERGRQNNLRGEDHPRARLSDADVLNIRSLDLPRTEVADMYGITRQHVGVIVRRQKWTHI